ncbi:hypothetical protein T05_12412 [Trichinella murrelli]|uniref:Uncharacterized protein n=1 Tax=Trichinella murrelli TaxID=144512 RepID=A0A0V0T7J0_9BILA|nr:hypothetical protein T05_12412 [Trichinella murrelli]
MAVTSLSNVGLGDILSVSGISEDAAALATELLSLVELANKVVDQCQNNHNENCVTANSQRIDSFTFVTASSLLRLIQPHFVAVACSANYGKVTPSMTEQRHR